MTMLSSLVRGPLGLRNIAGHAYRNRMGDRAGVAKSQMDATMQARVICSSRYFMASVKGGKAAAKPEAAKAGATKAEHATKVDATKVDAAKVAEAYADPALKFKKGKYTGLGLPRQVGQPEDLPSIEFGKPTGMYNFVRHQHGDPRGHLRKDGRYKEKYDTDGFHWFDAYTDVPKQKFTIVNGETMIVGKETRPMEELFGVEQTNIPFHPRRRLNLWGNHNIVLRAEFCFFWIPTFIILSLAIPCYTMIYMMDEAVATSMTVKVIGHQWYWVYEVESPPETK